MAEAIASQLSGGAGRFVDSYWPIKNNFRTNGNTPSAAIIDRLDRQNSQSATLSNLGNMNAGFNINVLGRSGATIGAVAAGAPNGLQWTFQPWVIQTGLLGNANGPRITDQMGAWRVQMLAWFVNPAVTLGTAVDYGLELCTAGGTFDDGSCLRLGTPGMGFRVYDTNKLEVFMRATQAGAVTRVDVATAATGYDPAQWHMYEIRIIAANGPTPGAAKFYLDGVLVLTLNWGMQGAAQIMPYSNNNTAGLKVFVVSSGGNAIGFDVDQVNFQAARDELNLL
jgi:hypothetical protein